MYRTPDDPREKESSMSQETKQFLIVASAIAVTLMTIAISIAIYHVNNSQDRSEVMEECVKHSEDVS